MHESLQMLQFFGLSLAEFVAIGVIVYFAGGGYRDFSQPPPPEPRITRQDSFFTRCAKNLVLIAMAVLS